MTMAGVFWGLKNHTAYVVGASKQVGLELPNLVYTSAQSTSPAGAIHTISNQPPEKAAMSNSLKPPFTITGPGFYATRDGRKAEVFVIPPQFAAAYGAIGDVAHEWNSQGVSGSPDDNDNLVAVWTDSASAPSGQTTLISNAAKQGYALKAIAEEPDHSLKACTCPMAPGFGGILHVAGCKAGEK